MAMYRAIWKTLKAAIREPWARARLIAKGVEGVG